MAKTPYINPTLNPRKLRKADFPMRLPFALGSPPTITVGAANGTTQISGSVLIQPWEPGAFQFLGPTQPYRYSTYPGYAYLTVNPLFTYTSPPPWGAEFWIDTTDATGRFEVYGFGTGHGCRLQIRQADGSWGYAPSFSLNSDGNPYLTLITLGAAGRYRCRLEFDTNFSFAGIRVTPGTTVWAPKDRRRYAVVGDSFTEPTIVDSGTAAGWDGWCQQLSHLTDVNVISAGLGATGYLNTAGGTKKKFRDRLPEILALGLDGIIFAGGINDGAFTGAQVAAELLLCIAVVRAYNPLIDIIVLSPFMPRDIVTASFVNTIDLRDGLKAASAQAGVMFLDMMSINPLNTFARVNATMQAAASANATSISVNQVPHPVSGYYVQIGTGANAEIRYVSNITGSGPYTLTLSAGLTYAQASGTPVALSGPAYISGSGKQGTPTGVGTADRITGSDGTHPTVFGHRHIATVVADLWTAALAW